MEETEYEKEQKRQAQRKEQLTRMLKERDELDQKLKQLDADILRTATPYWRGLGFTMLPRIEKLRFHLGV